jgi:hypothetical protein
VQRFAAQIEEAVFQADVFRIVRLAEDRQRQFAGLDRTSISRANISISPVGRLALTVSSVRGLTSPSTRMTHSPRTRLGVREAWRIRVGNDLGNAVVVTQVDEKHAAMVADAVDPSGEPDIGAGVALAKRGARCGNGSDACHILKAGASR